MKVMSKALTDVINEGRGDNRPLDDCPYLASLERANGVMRKKRMKIELFYLPGCDKCARAKDELKTAAEHVVAKLTWREINALDEMDYAVELGVTALPSIAIDGVVVFCSLPTPQQLCAALRRRATEEMPDLNPQGAPKQPSIG